MNKMGENKIMKKYKGVVFFDYDGTTVDEVDEIKNSNTNNCRIIEQIKRKWISDNVMLRKNTSIFRDGY